MVVRNWTPVGGNPAPGDPSAYDQLAKALGEVADSAESVHGRLQRLKGGCDTSIWRGDAADAFREDIGKLPADLKKLLESYRAAASAMVDYGCTLRELTTEANTQLDVAEVAAAEVIAFVLSVAAIVIVVVVALGVPGLNVLTLGLASTLFTMA